MLSLFFENKGRSWKEISKRSCSGDIGKNIRSNYLKKTIYWNPKNYRKVHNKTIYLGLKLKPTQGKINLTSNTEEFYVYVDKKFIGKAKNDNLTIGLNTMSIDKIEISKIDYDSKTISNRNIKFNSSNEFKNKIDLQKNSNIYLHDLYKKEIFF